MAEIDIQQIGSSERIIITENSELLQVANSSLHLAIDNTSESMDVEDTSEHLAFKITSYGEGTPEYQIVLDWISRNSGGIA